VQQVAWCCVCVGIAWLRVEESNCGVSVQHVGLCCVGNVWV